MLEHHPATRHESKPEPAPEPKPVSYNRAHQNITAAADCGPKSTQCVVGGKHAASQYVVWACVFCLAVHRHLRFNRHVFCCAACSVAFFMAAASRAARAAIRFRWAGVSSFPLASTPLAVVAAVGAGARAGADAGAGAGATTFAGDELVVAAMSSTIG
jgi:hypothetical protein